MDDALICIYIAYEINKNEVNNDKSEWFVSLSIFYHKLMKISNNTIYKV